MVEEKYGRAGYGGGNSLRPAGPICPDDRNLCSASSETVVLTFAVGLLREDDNLRLLSRFRNSINEYAGCPGSVRRRRRWAYPPDT